MGNVNSIKQAQKDVRVATTQKEERYLAASAKRLCRKTFKVSYIVPFVTFKWCYN